MNTLRIGAIVSTVAFGIVLPARAQRAFRADTAALQRILTAEDRRGGGTNGLDPLLQGIHGADSMLRRVAARGIGRLQRPELALQLGPLLADKVTAVRIEAANAIAQSMARVRRVTTDPSQVEVHWAATTLATALATEADRNVGEAIAEALGRLPFGDSVAARQAEGAILQHAGGTPGFGTVHGLYTLAQNRPTNGAPSSAAMLLLKTVAFGSGDAPTRRVAVYTLGIMRSLDSAIVTALMRDPDDQLRRLALAGVGSLAPGSRATVVQAAFADPSPIVRIAAVGAARVGSRQPDCSLIVLATNDAHPYVAQVAIDALGSPCADTAAAVAALRNVLADGGAKSRSWVLRSHAMVAWAKLGGLPLSVFARSTDPQAQQGIAEAGAVLGDTAVLLRATRSADHNVRELAITGLARWLKHDGDSVYIAALTSPGYQVVLAAAGALTGTKHPAALPALLDAFDRLSAERRENAKDPRVAVLKRISELGSNLTAPRLTPYLADFDTTIAVTVAAMMTKWTGTEFVAQPAPLRIPVEPLANTYLARRIQLRVTMAGGGAYTIRLLGSDAPATVARILKLVRAHYYDGHVFQRVEPNFVVQGGGPDASEYVGDARFMRDEVTAHSHLRGTLGISSRGRDTGDAQWFFNLTDNTRLDHDYTVFGEVVAGLDVVERIMAGNVIAKVVVQP